MSSLEKEAAVTNKGRVEILSVLGDVLANELTAVNQYLRHGETCANTPDAPERRRARRRLGGGRDSVAAWIRLVERIARTI